MNLNTFKSKINKDNSIKKYYNDYDFQYQIIKELIKLRNSYQMSIEDFAELCEIDDKQLYEIELGKSIPSITTIQNIVNHTKYKIQFKII